MVSSELLKKYDFKEEDREVSTKGDYAKTGYPEPKKYYEIEWDVYDLSLEKPYFWVIDNFRQYVNYVEKIEDTFTAAENSAFFGISQQRLGAQQDKISQFLATTGKMIKELFQMVRELRIIDERLEYYDEAEAQKKKPLKDRSKSAEITLKGLFVDLVQGGGKSAASVYGMARELEFITLPDLFFDAPPFANVQELDAHLKSLEKDFNTSVLRVLQRHLRQYMEWAKRTTIEHQNRRRFMLQYLLQHYEIIRMYITWVKPYLRHVEQLTLRNKNLASPDIITAFEGSILEAEILVRRHVPVGNDGVNGTILVSFRYRTRPELKVVQEGYQRGPVHVGKMTMNYRVYAWKDKQVEAYKKMKEEENLIIMGDISSSVREAMESLGKELESYLVEAKAVKSGKKKEEEKKELPHKTFMQKFFGDFYHSSPATPAKKHHKVSAKEIKEHEKEMKKAMDEVMAYTKLNAWNGYKNFKKEHGMLQW